MFERSLLSKAALLILAGTVATVEMAHAQETSSSDAQNLQRVEITGSSIKRIDAETALPVQVLNREQISRTGATNVEQLMQTIGSVSSSGGIVSASAAGATTGGISAISIHGLSSLRTLVLINGRRVAPYGIGFSNDSVSVDVNSIPLAAVERVEILQDGGSAIYGSDAIAGVVNFILRSDFKGGDITGEYGTSTRGGGAIKKGSAVIGFGDFASDKYNLMVVASGQREDSLFGRQRNFAKSGINVDHLNDTTSGNTFPANIAAVDGSFGTHNPTNPTGCAAPYSTLDPLLSPNGCRFDPSPLVTLVPQTERVSLFASGRLAINNDAEIYSEASINQNKIRTVIQPVPLSDQFTLPSNNVLYNQSPYNGFDTVILKTSSPYYPTTYVQGITGGATPDLLVRYRAAGAGNRDFTDVSVAPRFVLGLKGSAKGWDYDTSALHTSSYVREQINGGYPILSEFLPILNSGNVNFFGPSTDAVNEQLQAATFNGDAFSTRTSISSLQAHASRDVIELPAGAMSLALGGEVRRETYHFSPSNEISTGDLAGYGGNLLPVDVGRNVGALFGEINAPIFKGFEADAALRYDHYQGTGNSYTPKLTLRYQVAPSLLLRGSAGKGFRAPSLADRFAGNTTGVTPTGLSDSARCPTTADDVHDCNTQFPTLNGGNPNLKPEKAENFTLGTVFEPINNLSVGIDYFVVRLTDTIVNGVDASTILSDESKYGYLITRGAAGPGSLPGQITQILQTNVNLGSTKLDGLEFNVKYAISAQDYGKFNIGLNGTYFSRFNTQNIDGSYSGGVGTVNTATGGVIPRWKHYLTVDWTRGPWTIDVAQNFQLGYQDTAGSVDDESNTRRAGVYLSYDAQATYEYTKNWKFTFGGHNLQDHNPPYVNTNAAFQSGYDPQYYDARGRYLYGRVNYTF